MKEFINKSLIVKAILGGIIYIILLYFLNQIILTAWLSSFLIAAIMTYLSTVIAAVFKTIKIRKDIMSGIIAGLFTIIYNTWGTTIVELNYIISGIGHSLQFFIIYFITGFIVVFLANFTYDKVLKW